MVTEVLRYGALTVGGLYAAGGLAIVAGSFVASARRIRFRRPTKASVREALWTVVETALVAVLWPLILPLAAACAVLAYRDGDVLMSLLGGRNPMLPR